MSYTEPKWIDDFKKHRLNLETVTDKQLSEMWDQALKVHASNETTYNLAMSVYNRMVKDAEALYGIKHLVTHTLQRNRPKPPSLELFRKVWRTLHDAVSDARAAGERKARTRARLQAKAEAEARVREAKNAKARARYQYRKEVGVAIGRIAKAQARAAEIARTPSNDLPMP